MLDTVNSEMSHRSVRDLKIMESLLFYENVKRNCMFRIVKRMKTNFTGSTASPGKEEQKLELEELEVMDEDEIPPFFGLSPSSRLIKYFPSFVKPKI